MAARHEPLPSATTHVRRGSPFTTCWHASPSSAAPEASPLPGRPSPAIPPDSGPVPRRLLLLELAVRHHRGHRRCGPVRRRGLFRGRSVLLGLLRHLVATLLAFRHKPSVSGLGTGPVREKVGHKRGGQSAASQSSQRGHPSLRGRQRPHRPRAGRPGHGAEPAHRPASARCLTSSTTPASKALRAA